MNVLYWNARGIGNSDTRVALKNLVMSQKPMLIIIAEPMILLFDFFRDRCGLPRLHISLVC